MLRYRRDPVAYVRERFSNCDKQKEPGHDRQACKGCTEPDEWQIEALQSVAKNPRTGMSACKGPGKSCVLAWIILWWLETRTNSQSIVMSITKENLRDNLWKEISLWFWKSDTLSLSFDMMSEYIRSKSKRYEKTWWVSARAFPKQADKQQQANTLAGFHGPHCLVVMDEMGDYPHGVPAAAEGIFYNVDTEARIVAAWNPTDPNGPAGTACTKHRHKWHIITITGDPDDPKRSPRIPIEIARQEIADNGRDDPWVMINILGLFPPSSSFQCCKTNDVNAAHARKIPRKDYLYAPRILGVDPARGGIDRTVIFPRQGYQAFKPIIMRTDNTMEVVGRIVQAINAWDPHAVFIDVIGIGAGVVDRLREMGYTQVIACDFREKSSNRSFFNNRMKCWGLMSEWMPYGSIPHVPGLIGELTEPVFNFKSDGRKILCPKDDLEHSPDLGDGLALTFSYEVPMPEIHDFIDPMVLADMPLEVRRKIERDFDSGQDGGVADYNPLTSR